MMISNKTETVKIMTQEREDLIREFEKWFATNPNPSITAAQCANIAENYAESKIKNLTTSAVMSSTLPDPRQWFMKKFNVTESRMNLIEHRGNDVVRFINEYINNNEL